MAEPSIITLVALGAYLHVTSTLSLFSIVGLSPAYILATVPVYDPTELSRANRVATVQRSLRRRTLSRPDPDLADLSRQLMYMHHGAI